MKRIESLYNRWLEQSLDRSGQEEVIRELGGRSSAERERQLHAETRTLLRELCQPTEPPSPDFINAQVLERIAAERKAAVQREKSRRGFAIAGGLLTAAAVLLSAVILPQVNQPADSSEMVSRLIEAQTTEPGVYASTFRTPDGEGLVIWVEGAQYIPAERKIRR